MGYEIKLLIGHASNLMSDEFKDGEPELDGNEVYIPHLKDDKGAFIKTGRKKSWFAVYATVDLCKCGYDSNMHKIEHENKEESHFWYWYDGNGEASKDCYGTKLKPIPIKEVVEAMGKDLLNGDYRRFKWALPLLQAMQDDEEGLSVLMYGH